MSLFECAAGHDSITRSSFFGEDLEDAKKRLEKVLAQHSDVISAVKRELEPPDEDSDDDEQSQEETDQEMGAEM